MGACTSCGSDTGVDAACDVCLAAPAPGPPDRWAHATAPLWADPRIAAELPAAPTAATTLGSRFVVSSPEAVFPTVKVHSRTVQTRARQLLRRVALVAVLAAGGYAAVHYFQHRSAASPPRELASYVRGHGVSVHAGDRAFTVRMPAAPKVAVVTRADTVPGVHMAETSFSVTTAAYEVDAHELTFSYVTADPRAIGRVDAALAGPDATAWLPTYFPRLRVRPNRTRPTTLLGFPAARVSGTEQGRPVEAAVVFEHHHLLAFIVDTRTGAAPVLDVLLKSLRISG